MTVLDDAFETIRRAHDDSSLNLLADRAAAGGDLALIKRINRNHQMLTIQLLDAASAVLEANNPGVDAALTAATDANAAVAKRRKKAAGIVKIVDGVSSVVDAGAGLLKALHGSVLSRPAPRTPSSAPRAVPGRSSSGSAGS